MKLLFAVFCILLSCYFQDANAQLRLIGIKYPSYGPNSTVLIFNKYGKNICTGALIHPEWIVTSATCGLRTHEEEMRVMIGGSVTPVFNNAAHIKNTYVHEGFSAWFLDNDIALIKLVAPVSSTVRTLRISSDNGLLTGKKAYVLGYGNNNNENAEADGTLRKQRVSILDYMLCSQYPIYMNCDKVCTYEARGCEGDQGGPLVSEDMSTLIALISITDDQAAMCGGDRIIPVTSYTRADVHKDWIIKTTKVNYL